MTPTLINLRDYEQAALERLPPNARDYYASGAHDEISLRRNRTDFDDVRLWPRMLVDVARRDLSVSILGTPATMPVMIAPTAFHRMAHSDGECGTAKAAAQAGVPMIVSTLSTTDIEEIAAAAPGAPRWFQLYIYRDRAATLELLRRVEAAGVTAIALTVDCARLGVRERDVRNGFALPPGLSVRNMAASGLNELPRDRPESGLAAYFIDLIDPSVSWPDVEWLLGHTRLPIVLKGIMRADDARRAMEMGCAGVIVSNHGGRQLDTAPSGIEALPPIARAVAGRGLVLMDGGVRRGTDVLKALASGAHAVCVGRPVLWGLTVNGTAGVAHVLELLRREIDLAMALCGCPDIASIGPWLLNAGE